jgi:hypothetical protein
VTRFGGDLAFGPAQLSALATASYLGAYANEYFGDIDVIAKDGVLTLSMGPRKTPFLLRHHDRDAFELLGESGENLGGALFAIGPERQASTVTIVALDLRKQGIFTRRPNRK